MYKIFNAEKDTYITNRVINNVRMLSGNVGSASTLDLFKLYGISSTGSTPNAELSRLLIKFDLDPIRSLISASLVDINDQSFKCYIKLFDVYAGQPTPKNFTVTLHPLSRSFDEGLGRDVVGYTDADISNFLTSSRSEGGWNITGSGQPGGNGDVAIDYLTSFVENSQSASLEFVQTFVTGDENLLIDVTQAISATLINLIPDKGFRIALTSSLETDTRTYFVKRFASRHAYDSSKHPQLIMKFDDSVVSDVSNLSLNTSSSFTLYNYDSQAAANIFSGSTEITGTNSLLLTLSTPISGGTYSLTFSGSQVSLGLNNVVGLYSASVYVNSQNQNVIEKVNASGSIMFTPVWGSIDGSIGYHTGSNVRFYPTSTSTKSFSTTKYIVSVTNVPQEITKPDSITARVNVFDNSAPQIMLVKSPTKLPGLNVRNTFYQIRNSTTNQVVVPYDTVHNSTKCSSDSDGMFFVIDTGNLEINESYAVDILIVSKGLQREYKTSSTFKVKESL